MHIEWMMRVYFLCNITHTCSPYMNTHSFIHRTVHTHTLHAHNILALLYSEQEQQRSIHHIYRRRKIVCEYEIHRVNWIELKSSDAYFKWFFHASCGNFYSILFYLFEMQKKPETFLMQCLFTDRLQIVPLELRCNSKWSWNYGWFHSLRFKNCNRKMCRKKNAIQIRSNHSHEINDMQSKSFLLHTKLC